MSLFFLLNPKKRLGGGVAVHETPKPVKLPKKKRNALRRLEQLRGDIPLDIPPVTQVIEALDRCPSVRSTTKRTDEQSQDQLFDYYLRNVLYGLKQELERLASMPAEVKEDKLIEKVTEVLQISMPLLEEEDIFVTMKQKLKKLILLDLL